MSSLTQTAAPAPEPSGASDPEKARLMGYITRAITNLDRLVWHETEVQNAANQSQLDAQEQRCREMSDIRAWAKRIAPANTIEETYTAIISQFDLSYAAKNSLWLALYDYGE